MSPPSMRRSTKCAKTKKLRSLDPSPLSLPLRTRKVKSALLSTSKIKKMMQKMRTMTLKLIQSAPAVNNF